MKNINAVQLPAHPDYDIVGSVASIICIIHCVITPFLFAAHATVSSTCTEISPLWWKLLDYLFLIITFFAIYYTAKSTVLKWLPLLLYVLWSTLALLFFNKSYEIMHIPDFAIYIPAVCLSALHLYNRNYCKCQENECCAKVIQ